MSTRRHFVLASASSLALPALAPRMASAQSGGKLTRLIVPFPAGGGTDAVARLMAEKMRPDFAGGLIVDNKVGASGRVGAEYVRDSEPDGSTMLFTTDFVMTIYPHSFRKLGYDPLKDFAPVAMCSKTAYALTAGPGLPASVTNVQQFIAWCKANPKQASFASATAGSASHFTGVMLSRAAGVDILHVPYKGGALALQDLIGGQIPVSTNGIGEVLPQLKSGKLRVLATTGAQRSRFLPDVPTLAESGLPDVVVETWFGVFMPAKTPADAVAKASAAINAVVQRPEVRDGFAMLAAETLQSTPAGFATALKTDIERWGPIVKTSGFTADE